MKFSKLTPIPFFAALVISGCAAPQQAGEVSSSSAPSSVQQASADAPRMCKEGSKWAKLNWPGHPQHGTGVCLPEGDPHRY